VREHVKGGVEDHRDGVERGRGINLLKLGHLLLPAHRKPGRGGRKALVRLLARSSALPMQRLPAILQLSPAQNKPAAGTA
jgi:hypothetical protein